MARFEIVRWGKRSQKPSDIRTERDVLREKARKRNDMYYCKLTNGDLTGASQSGMILKGFVAVGLYVGKVERMIAAIGSVCWTALAIAS